MKTHIECAAASPRRLDLSSFPEHVRLRAVFSLMLCAGNPNAARRLVAGEVAREVADLNEAIASPSPSLHGLLPALRAQRDNAEQALSTFTAEERNSRAPREERKAQCAIAGEHLLFRLVWTEANTDDITDLFVERLVAEKSYKGTRSVRRIREALSRFRGVAHWAAANRLLILTQSKHPPLERFLGLGESIRLRGCDLPGALGAAMREALGPPVGIETASDLDELLAIQGPPRPETLERVRESRAEERRIGER